MHVQKALLCIIALFYSVNPQVKKQNERSFIDCVTLANMMVPAYYELLHYGDTSDTSTKKILHLDNDNLLSYFNNSVLSNDSVNRILTSKTNLSYLIKYQNEIDSVISHCGLFGELLGEFYFEKKDVPFKFVRDGNNMIFMISGIVYDKVFNTLKTSSKDRASKIAQSIIFPSFNNFERISKIPNVNKLSITITYYSKDFSEDESPGINLKAENLTGLFNISDCSLYVNSKLSEDQLMKSSLWYLQDRSMLSKSKLITLQSE